MALKNKFLLVIINFLFFTNVYSAIVLPELLAKQAISNIRFLAQNGKFTYYQKRSGSLLFSSNYKVIEMLKGDIGTQYEVIGTSSRKKLAITQNINFHNFYSVRANEKIFISNYGESQVREIGLGTNPQLHVEDNWISYYNFYKRTLFFEHTVNSALNFTIKLNNRINPYFLPKVVMPDENTIYYTDLSETGAPGLLEFKRTVGKSDLIYKSPSIMNKIEICLKDKHLIMGTFGLNFSTTGSSIAKIALPLKDFTKRETIYTSQENDIGQLVCDYEANFISFIKNFGKTVGPSYDIVDLNIATRELKQLSELKNAISLINMDGTLLTLDKGKYLIVKGSADFKNIDSLKSLPPSGASEAIKQIDQGQNNE